MALDENSTGTYGIVKPTGNFGEDVKGAVLYGATAGLSSACGGGKSKPKPWAKMPGGKLSYRGKKIIDAGNYLLPATVDLTRRGAEAFGDIYRSESEKTRADELAGFEKYGPRYVQALDAADPLRAKAKGIISANLDAGLDPSIAREISQGSRAAFSSRGMLNSPQSAVDELFALGIRGKQIEDANLSRAMEFSRGTDPFLAYAGRPSAPQGSNPMSPNYASYSDNLPSFTANDEMMAFNASQNAKNRNAELAGAAIKAGGSLLGGAAGFI